MSLFSAPFYRDLASRPWAARLARYVRWLVVAFIVVLLGFQMSRIGWADILSSLPTEPLFYVIFVVLYLTLPVNELVIYRLIWRIPIVQGMLALLKKRVYNKDVLGYSGEVFLYLWLGREVGLPRDRVWKVIKDNAIVSSVASTAFAVGVLILLLMSGQILVAQHFIEYDATLLALMVVVAAVLGAVGYRFRRWIFVLPLSTLALIFLSHIIRLAFTNGMQVVQWAVVLPELSLAVWFTLLSLMIVTSRIPLLPARDLAFISLAVEVSALMGVASAPIVAMLLVSSALDKGFNLIAFLTTTLLRNRIGVPVDDVSSTEATGESSHPAVSVHEGTHTAEISR